VSDAPARIRLLGGLAVEIDGRSVPDAAWSRRNGAALVALLALAPHRRLHREQVIDALWPELSVAEAAPRFHKAAHHARRALGATDALVVRAEMATLLPDGDPRIDVTEFAAAAEVALAEGTALAADAALSLCAGELLPEFRYEEWSEEPRLRYRLLQLQLLRQAARWEDIVELDPTDEGAHVELMRRFHDDGAHRAALLQYDHLAQALQRELGDEPGPAARQLRDRIAAAADIDAPPNAGPQQRAPVRLGELPQPSDELLGREATLATLAAACATSRVVTLFGPGGVGKTRLAVEFVRTQPLDSVFVDLSRVTDEHVVARAVLDALGASTRAGVPDVDRVVETLEQRAVLLLVDNGEHLVDAVAEIAGRLTRDTVETRVLVTSREALGIPEETVVAVTPLQLPPSDATPAQQRSADAVRLFCERAERAGGATDDLRSVVALARRLDGIPLALELAAARSRTFSPEQMLAQIDEGWPMTTVRRAAGPAHHISLDEAVDWSFRLLDDDERSLLLHLSVFRGSFDVTAAATVADVVAIRAADLLARLVDKSLVQSADGRAGRRLRLLDTVRRFAASRLDPTAAADARVRHAAYYADRVSRLGAAVPGPGEDHALAQLGVELDDVAAAFEHAAEHADVDIAARLVDGPRLSLSAEGARWAHLALDAVELPGLAGHPLHLSILASAAWGAVLEGDLVRARALAQRGIEAAGDPSRHARLAWIWPQATGTSFAAGVECCLVGARVAHDAGDLGAESFLLATAAIYRLMVGDETGAVEAAEQALDLAHEVRSRSLRARAGGALAYALQDLDADGARAAAAEVLEVAAPGDFHLNMPHRVLANLAWRAGDARAAAEHAMRAGELIRDQGDRYVQAAAMRQLAVMVGDVDAELAGELLGVADGIIPGIPVIERDVRATEELHERLVQQLGDRALEALMQRGRRTDARAVFAVARRGIERLDRAPR
jgi:predicted ATPase/DNA-binding SARP family transcriptional activator